MEFVLGILLVAAVVWFLARRGRKDLPKPPVGSSSTAPPSAGNLPTAESPSRTDIELAVLRDYGTSRAASELRKVTPGRRQEHVPPSPNGQASEAWSPRTQQLEVAGEWYRAQNLRTLFTRHAKVSDNGTEIRLPAVLVPDPTNPHDKNAVAVFVDGLHVGYMERAHASTHHPVIAKLPGGELVVPSRQWLRGTSNDTWARVTLSLPKPEHLECPNPSQDKSVTLPPGSTVQVTKEEAHMEHLAPLLARYGSDTVVAASLRSVTEQRPRSTVDVVAVDIDGQQVGVLSPTQTANFLPLVRRAESEGLRIT